jgi:hypothetical protein
MSNQLCLVQRLIDRETDFQHYYLMTFTLKERVKSLTRSFNLVLRMVFFLSTMPS